MTEIECKEVIERVRAIAGTCYSMVTEGEIKDVINRVNPHISVYQMEHLIQDCKQYVQIVSAEEKQKMLQNMYPEQYAENKPDPALIDSFFCILLHRNMDSSAKAYWESVVDSDERFHTILQNRRNLPPESLAEVLGISLEELYYLEREIIKLYYSCSSKVTEGKV